MISKNSTCAYCGVGCGIKANIDTHSRTIEITGDQSHPANQGRLCSKGSALGQTVGMPSKHEFGQRLLSPFIQGKKVSWDNALDKIANDFKSIIEKHGSNSVAFYGSGQLLTEDYYVANKLMKGFIGSANIDTNSRLCMASSVSGHKRAFGTDTVPGCYEDFEQADLITLVGSNTAWCHPVLFQRIKTYKETNPEIKVIVIDPRHTQTCQIADLHLPLKPGTDVNLFNGLLAYLADHKQLDQSFITQHCEHFEDALATAQKTGTLDQVAHQIGIEKNTLTEFYRLFANTEKSITLYSQGVNQSSAGTDKVNSILNCHLATGRIGKLGMGPFSMTGQPNAMGGREVGGMANTLAAHMDFCEDNIDRLNRFWSTKDLTANVPKTAGLTAVDLFNAVDAGSVKAIWIMATNPVFSLPNANLVKQALNKCELVVVSDCIADTDTSRLADVLLPATGWSEKDGTVTNSERRISRQRRLLLPAGEAKHDWWIISEVAKRMGFGEAFSYKKPVDIFREHATLSGFENHIPINGKGRLRDFDISAWSNISDEDYDNLIPTQWPVNQDYPNGRKRFFADGLFYTENRKAQFIATIPRAPENLPNQHYPFVLNTGRIRDQWHSMTRTSLATRLNQHIAEPFIDIHPVDANDLALQDKQLVQVNSRWGSMLGRLAIKEGQQQGSLYAPMHWTETLSTAGKINPLVNPSVDPISNQPESKHTPVSIQSFKAKWHGFILSRHSIPWPELNQKTLDYIIQIEGNNHIRYELAHSGTLDYPERQLRQWLNATDNQHVAVYEDASSCVFRMAIFSTKKQTIGQIEAIAFVAPYDPAAQNLPDRTWLASLFGETQIHNQNQNQKYLLGGHAPKGEDIGPIVCACFGVGENSIKQAILKHELTTASEIGYQLNAGRNCGSCIPELNAILADHYVEV